MEIIKNFRTFILEDDFRLTFINNKVDIVNYESIIHFDNSKIIVKTPINTVEVVGDNLVVSKLLIDEILISGNISKIEFR